MLGAYSDSFKSIMFFLVFMVRTYATTGNVLTIYRLHYARKYNPYEFGAVYQL